MKCICYAERRAKLASERSAKEREEFEANQPLMFRISARIEVWALVLTAEAAALAFAAGWFR